MSQHTDRGAPPLPEIGGYRVARLLGSGGMSTIYLGEQLSLGRKVAIKVMLPEALADEVSRRRFENEARTVARLDHPNIVGIHDVGRTRDGLPYYSTPYMSRGHLGQRDLGGDQRQVRAILRALLSALAYAHARGIVHRDVKAENVLFDEAERPLLADFGIALRRGYGSRVTTAGLAVGSTAYMAPEQARGEDVDARADLYSVGVLTWEMLCGELPFNAGDALSMAVMHAQDPIPRLPRDLRHWQPFIDRALAKSPGKRFRDAAQMLAALERVPERSGAGASGTRVRQMAQRVRALPKVAWIGIVLVLAAGIGLGTRTGDEQPRFFRAADGAGGRDSATGLRLPVPATRGGAVTSSPDDAMLRAAPESDAERWIVAAERQMREGKLVAPANDNAYASLLNAWQADSAHLRISTAIDQLIAALGQDALRRIAAGDDDQRAHATVAQATQLAARTARADGVALRTLRGKVREALAARIAQAARQFDREDALRSVELARRMSLDPATVRKLDASAGRIPLPGGRMPGGSVDMVLVSDGKLRIGAMPRLVSRDQYAAFASATGREPALCRERASLLRIVKPRDWKDPGFEQAGPDPVACVSWADANAYAQWLGARDGVRYRVPAASEARRLPAAGGGRALAEWQLDCGGGDCNRRVAAGRSWRGDAGQGAREADRGYDDVGFRLVREL